MVELSAFIYFAYKLRFFRVFIISLSINLLLSGSQALAVRPTFSCAGVIHGNFLPRFDLKVGDIAVDYNMGLIQFMGYESTTDTGKVFIFDEAFAKRFYKQRETREELASRALFVTNFSNRRIAKVGTENSAKIVRSRIQDFFGLDHIAIYFGLYPLIQRLRPASQFAFKREYLQVIDTYFPSRFLDVAKLLKYFRDLSFRRSASIHAEADFTKMYALLIELSGVTGENLFHTGILATFARPRFSNWVWPINSGPYSFESDVLGLTNLRYGVPRDIDHYARSWLWGETQYLNIPESTLTADDAVRTLTIKNTFSNPKPNFALTSGTTISVERSRDIPAFFMTYSQSDPFWLRIFEVAGSTDLRPKQVKGQSVRFILTDNDLARAKRIAEELKRVSYDFGARHVEVTINSN